MIETLFIALCLLVSLVPIAFLLRRYLRRNPRTPFLTKVRTGKRMVPFGIVQVRRLAEKSAQGDE